EVALARGNPDEAVEAARLAFLAVQSARHEDLYPDIVVPMARAILAGGIQPEKEATQSFLQLILAMTAQRTLDEDVRVRWFRGPWGRNISALAGPFDTSAPQASGAQAEAEAAPFDEPDRVLLRLRIDGRSHREIAEQP